MSKLAHSDDLSLLLIVASARGIKVSTSFDYPPIPIRSMDWSAIDSNTYDADCDEDGFFSSCPVGYGATEAEAVSDLLEKMDG